MRGDAFDDVGEIGDGIEAESLCTLNEGVEDLRPFAASLETSQEEIVLSAQDRGANRVLTVVY